VTWVVLDKPVIFGSDFDPYRLSVVSILFGSQPILAEPPAPVTYSLFKIRAIPHDLQDIAMMHFRRLHSYLKDHFGIPQTTCIEDLVLHRCPSSKTKIIGFGIFPPSGFF
jgi:hypothetical protein